MKKIKKNLLAAGLATAAIGASVGLTTTSCNNNDRSEHDLKANIGLTPSFIMDMKTEWEKLSYKSRYYSYYGKEAWMDSVMWNYDGSKDDPTDGDYFSGDFQISLNVDAENIKGLVSQFSIVDASSFKDVYGLDNPIPLGQTIKDGQITDFKLALSGGIHNGMATIPPLNVKSTITNYKDVFTPALGGKVLHQSEAKTKAYAVAPTASYLPPSREDDALDKFYSANQGIDPVQNGRLKFKLGSETIDPTQDVYKELKITEKVELNYFLNFDLATNLDEVRYQRVSFYDAFDVVMAKGIGNPLSISVKDGYRLMPSISIESKTVSQGLMEFRLDLDSSASGTSPDQQDPNRRTLKAGTRQEKFNVSGFAAKRGPEIDLDELAKKYNAKFSEAGKSSGNESWSGHQYKFDDISLLVDLIRVDGTPLENAKTKDFFEQGYADTWTWYTSVNVTWCDYGTYWYGFIDELVNCSSHGFTIPSTYFSYFNATWGPDGGSCQVNVAYTISMRVEFDKDTSWDGVWETTPVIKNGK